MSTGRALHEEKSGAADMDQANGIFPAENEEEYDSGVEKVSWIREKAAHVITSSSVFALDCLIKYILIVCCFVVAMPSLKREAERKGKEPADTGTSANSEGRVSSLAEETDEPARGSGSFHWCDQLHRLIHLSEDLWHDLR
ncbi:hypothetical protein T4E_9002 [Trichinella pseudospiralis]|uniref:Uncharacterized protein n=1 Tax=Trichinella pseudospiralis TaxID=6337 RepID=A0A0V0YHH4_TRIPS|nr:hypothetical protein T4E_9002 [Trichinella pseudospiralis]